MDAPTGNKPTSEIPKSLKNILDVLFEQNGLRSWQIYSEPKGLTVKLRFAECQDGGQTVTDSKVSYVRKAPAQVRRDTKRAEEYQRQTRSMSKHAVEQVELPRRDSISDDIIMSSQVADTSPASVHMDSQSAMSGTPDPMLSLSHLSDQPPLTSARSIDSMSECGTVLSEVDNVNKESMQSADQIPSQPFSRHTEDIIPYSGSVQSNCEGCNISKDHTYPKSFVRRCNHTYHEGKYFHICNVCFHKGFHAVHKDQIKVYQFPTGPGSHLHCDACGTVSKDTSSEFLYCSLCPDYVLCRQCVDTSVHKYHKNHMVIMHKL